MADFDIHPGQRRHLNLAYKNAAGGPGSTEAPPTWDLSDELGAKVDVDPDGLHGTIAHNGTVVDLTVTNVADGDLGPGINRIVETNVFHMLAPLGATVVDSTVSDEEAIPA